MVGIRLLAPTDWRALESAQPVLHDNDAFNLNEKQLFMGTKLSNDQKLRNHLKLRETTLKRAKVEYALGYSKQKIEVRMWSYCRGKVRDHYTQGERSP